MHLRKLLPTLFSLIVSAPLSHAEHITFTELMYNPAGTKPEYIEIKNLTYTPRDFAKWSFTKGITYQFPDFNTGSPQAHIFGPLEKIIVSSADPATTRAAYPWIPAQQRVFGPWTGSLSNSGEEVVLEDLNGVKQAIINYKGGGRWPKAADGTGHSLVIVNQDSAPDDWRNWKTSGSNRSSISVSTVIVNYGDTWKWHIPSSDPGSSWRTIGFNDTGWSSGAGLFGYETAPLPSPGIQTPLPAGNVPHLFRKTFTFSGNPAGATIKIDQVVDDGVVYYLNGNLLQAIRMDNGLAWNANALPQVGDAGEELGTPLPATGLTSGTNVLCAEVHNGGPGSSDLVFGARATITEGGAPITATLRLNEVHFDSAGKVDWIELENFGGSTQSASGLFLSSKNDFSDKVALTGSINAGAYQSFTIPNGGFDTDGSGSVAIYLVDGGNNVLGAGDLTRVGGRDSLMAFWPSVPVSKPVWQLLPTLPEWYSSSTSTQNADNKPTLNSSVINGAIVINEIMNDPMSEQNNAEFLELYNRSGSSVNLTGWKLRGGIEFDFPSGTSIPAGGYLVVGGDKAWLQSVYTSATIVGNWTGKLGNQGDYLRLEDQHGNLADVVDYKTGGDWPDFSTHKGSSMELINPNMDNNRASAWRASNESSKSPFATYSFTATYQQQAPHETSTTWFGTVPWASQTYNQWGVSEADYKELQLFLARDGEVIVKDMKVTTNSDGSGPNMVSNPHVKSSNGSSASGWLCQGNHGESWMDYGPSPAELHIVSTGHGNQYPNHSEVDLTSNGGIQLGTTYTVSFQARWVRGYPRLIAHTFNYSLGRALLINVPNDLGTAGAINSRHNGTTPPQVDSVIHSPAVPKTSDVVKVTALVASPSTPTVQVFHRMDSINNGNSYSPQTMFDDGTNGDAIANDGVYTANISSHQQDKRIVQFYVQATAGGQTSLCPPRPIATGAGGELHPHPAMWVVDNRTIPSNTRQQRFIMSANSIDRMKSNSSPSFGAPKPEYGYKHARVSNDKFPCVFINNESDVFYGAEMREGGSRWHRTLEAQMKAAKWKLPDDRPFRMRTKSSYDHDLDYGQDYFNGPPYIYRGGINTRVVCYMLYLTGVKAINDAEWCWTILNPNEYPDYELYADNELTDNELINRSYENGGNGELYKIFEKWWCNDSYNDQFGSSDWVYKGTHESTRYVQEYQMRMRELDFDYSPLTDFFKIASDPASTRELQERVMDVNDILREGAVRAVCGDWDNNLANGKNGYFYRRPSDGRIITVNWDNDASFSPNDGHNPVIGGQVGPTPGDPNPYMNPPTQRPGFGQFINQGWVRRIYNYWLTELIDGFGSNNNPRMGAWLTAQKNAVTPATTTRNSMYDPDKNVTEAFYTEYFTRRRQDVLDAINQGTGGAPNAYTASFQITSDSGTAGSTITLNGTAPSKAFEIVVDNHPEAKLTWSNQVSFSLSGIVLRSNTNNFRLRMISYLGVQVGDHLDYSVNKSGNATPFMALEAEPDNVKLGETLVLNASGSYDPDNSAVIFTWSYNPTSGVVVTSPSSLPANSKREAIFSTPGIYSFTVQGSDGSGSSSVTRQVAVANTEDFEPFTNTILDTTRWIAGSMEPRDSNSPSRWYSLYEKPGSLVMHVVDNSAKGLSYVNSHPTLLRNLPPGSDVTILTELTLETRKTGSFFSGLYLETSEAKYAFGLENGTQITAKRSTGGSFTDITTPVTTFISNETKIRIRRAGGVLNFERKVDGVWSNLFTFNMGGGTLSKGGLFLSTSSAENARVAFDYVMVVDPANAGNSVYNSLRITEIMYNPRGENEAEYIELRNVGGATINLNGVKFTDGITLDNIGNVSLAAGEIGVVTENSVAFAAQFPGVTILAQWTDGNLNNGGEDVVLRDGDNNIIHDFFFSDTSPWPTGADGAGAALEVVNTNGDYSDPSNWRATGAAPGGGVDADGDGTPDAWEAKFGTNASDPLSKPRATTSVNGSNQTQISWQGINGQNYRVEYCDNLGDAWQTISGGGSVSGVNGTVSFSDPQLPRPTRRFYRIMAL